MVDEVMAAKGRGLTWEPLSRADPGRPRPRPFEVLLQEAFQRLGERVRAAGAETPTGQGVVMLHRATPLARYEPGRILLGRLIQEAREADRAPYGLWLLCPMCCPQGPATLGGHPVCTFADAEQMLLLRKFTDPEAVPVG